MLIDGGPVLMPSTIIMRNLPVGKYIRIRAWWSFNDAYRRRAAEDFRVPPDQETNLRRLLQLLDTNHPEKSIMKAEILRELGEFDPCLLFSSHCHPSQRSQVKEGADGGIAAFRLR